MGSDYQRLDGNAVAGVLQEVFGAEMTVATCRCGHCGKQGHVGTLHAYTQAPGIVLRCSACENVVLRIVRSPAGIYVDLRGMAFLRMSAAD